MVDQLTTAVDEHDLDLVALFEPFARVLELHVEVVVVGPRTEPKFLQLRVMHLLAGVLLLLLVLVLAIVHDLADGRPRVRRHLDKIEVRLDGHATRFLGEDDPDLAALGVDEADVADANAFIHAGFGGSSG